MAAVSTNYGTAGDSNLESSISASRSRGTKESSKSGSGSGSNSASRSRSLSRVRRKRAGTATRVPRSASKEQLCLDECHGGLHAIDDGSKKISAVKRADREKSPVRAPVRRSMFPLGASSSALPKVDKGKAKARAKDSVEHGSALEFECDAIELMPRLHRQYARKDEPPGADDDPEKMVIRKDVEYSVKYEDCEEGGAQE